MGSLKKLTPETIERSKVLIETVAACEGAVKKVPKAMRDDVISQVIREAKTRYPGEDKDALEWGVLYELGRRAA